jgi:hypothetical protein
MRAPYAPAVDGTLQHVRYEERLSDSLFVERIWRTESDLDDVCLAIADGRWDMMFLTHHGRTSVMITGPQTTAISIPHVAGSSWLGIRFQLGVTLQNLMVGDLVNEGMPLPDGTHDSFWFQSSVWSLPNYENVDTFVDRLVQGDLLATDLVVTAALKGEPVHWSPRALQYRFQRTIGLTAKTVQQIERAQRAMVLLEQGSSAADAVFQLGYYDQSHLINSLKRYIGRTPAQVANVPRPE